MSRNPVTKILIFSHCSAFCSHQRLPFLKRCISRALIFNTHHLQDYLLSTRWYTKEYLLSVRMRLCDLSFECEKASWVNDIEMVLLISSGKTYQWLSLGDNSKDFRVMEYSFWSCLFSVQCRADILFLYWLSWEK